MIRFAGAALAAGMALSGSAWSSAEASELDLTFAGAVSSLEYIYQPPPFKDPSIKIGDPYAISFRFNLSAIGINPVSQYGYTRISGSQDFGEFVSPSSNVFAYGSYTPLDLFTLGDGAGTGFASSLSLYGNKNTLAINVSLYGAALGLKAQIYTNADASHVLNGQTQTFILSSTSAFAEADLDFAFWHDGSEPIVIGFNPSSVTVAYVPLPASLPMFGAALLGLGALAWRQRVRGAPAR